MDHQGRFAVGAVGVFMWRSAPQPTAAAPSGPTVPDIKNYIGNLVYTTSTDATPENYIAALELIYDIT